jgi:hypothetical protein
MKEYLEIMETRKMNNEINALVNILTIIANSQGITVRELNKITNIPMEFIKKNLDYMSSNHELYLINLMPEEEYDEATCDCMDIKWTVYGYSEDTKLFKLNCLEKYLFKSIVTKNRSNFDEFLGVRTKSTYKFEDYKYKLCQISMAISNKKSLKVKYKNVNGIIQDFIVEPLGIVFYEFENILYVLGQYNNTIVTYRLDRISILKETKESFSRIEGFDIEAYLENIWGMEQGEPINVKVKFVKTGNVLYKVKRDLEYRKNKKIIEFKDYIIYEDIIIGVNSFRSWLRTYGGAAIVLEPAKLRDEIIDSANQCLKYYL